MHNILVWFKSCKTADKKALKRVGKSVWNIARTPDAFIGKHVQYNTGLFSPKKQSVHIPPAPKKKIVMRIVQNTCFIKEVCKTFCLHTFYAATFCEMHITHGTVKYFILFTFVVVATTLFHFLLSS